MIDFLLKSTISLIIFLGFYHLILEREKMHQFNRLYLLSSIVISLVIPFITFEIIKIVPAVQEINPVMPQFPTSFEKITPETLDYTPFILWSLYGITTFLLLLRFGKNIWKLQSKSNSNPAVKYKNATLVLVDEKALPHTFLNSIFINSDDYNNRNIEEELYTHELVHVSQKHTLDILFIEFLKVIFWFNPIYIFYKKAIQLNHEFLADEKVVASYNDIPFYQSLLLQKSSGNQTIYLASNLNYLVTKKRLLMMTKNTSNRIAFLKKIAIVPILAGLIYFFCFKVVAQEKKVSDENYKTKNLAVAYATTETNKEINKINLEEYFKDVRIKYYDNLILVEDKTKSPNTVAAKFPKLIFDKKYEQLTKDEKEEIEISLILSMQNPLQKKTPSQQEINEFKNSKKFAIWIDGKNVPNNELNKYKLNDFAYYSGSVILKNARTKKHPQPFQYWFYTQPYFEKQNIGKNKDKYPGDEIVIFKEGRNQIITPNEKSALKAEVISSEEEVVFVSKNMKKLKLIKADTLARYAQEKLEDKIYNTSEITEKPEFEGGMTAFFKYISAHFKIPGEVSNNKLKGKVYASFIIEKDGTLSNIKILKEMGYGTGEEAERVLKNSPKWKPGKINKKSVRTMYSLPIVIASE